MQEQAAAMQQLSAFVAQQCRYHNFTAVLLHVYCHGVHKAVSNDPIAVVIAHRVRNQTLTTIAYSLCRSDTRALQTTMAAATL